MGQILGNPVAFSQGRSPSHPDAAEVRPCLPDQVTPAALHERCGSHQERCLKILAVKNEVGHKVELLRRRCRSLRERWGEAWRSTLSCHPWEPCSCLVLVQRLKARNLHRSPETACMACTAEDTIGSGSVPTVQVNQIVHRDLGEAVEGATHRVQAVRAANRRWRRLQRREARQM